MPAAAAKRACAASSGAKSTREALEEETLRACAWVGEGGEGQAQPPLSNHKPGRGSCDLVAARGPGGRPPSPVRRGNLVRSRAISCGLVRSRPRLGGGDVAADRLGLQREVERERRVGVRVAGEPQRDEAPEARLHGACSRTCRGRVPDRARGGVAGARHRDVAHEAGVALGVHPLKGVEGGVVDAYDHA